MATATARTHYDLLGVSKDASQEDIRRAYLKLAKKYHPDKTGGDKAAEDKLKEINNAYDVLKNPDKRRKYDEELSPPFSNDSFSGGPFKSGPYQDFEGAQGAEFHASFEDLFGGLFGHMRSEKPSGPRPGGDVEVVLDVTLRDAATGAKKTLRIPHRSRCTTCNGARTAPGTQPQPCPECHGTGQISRGNGMYLMSQTCGRCQGSGTVIVSPCPGCAGAGYTTDARTVAVTIPAGADTGTRLRVAGQGHAGEPSAPDGDLYVTLQVAPDELFERDGADLVCEVPITLVQAALGATVRVPTLTGQADLKIPSGTQSGRVFRLRGMGMPVFGGRGKGHLLVRVQVEVPAHLTAHQKDILRQMESGEDPVAYPKRSAFLDKVKRNVRGWAASLLMLLGVDAVARFIG